MKSQETKPFHAANDLTSAASAPQPGPFPTPASATERRFVWERRAAPVRRARVSRFDDIDW
jgi:hypothetical protein